MNNLKVLLIFYELGKVYVEFYGVICDREL